MVKIRNEKVYLFYLAFLAATPPLATDMYLPAIPDLAVLWDVARSTVNLSLVLWFVFFSLFLLIYGPLSDKYGRKPVLFAGLILFVSSSLLCALSANVQQLIGFRILQGIGAASPSAMAMAICRDRFEGKRRQQMLAYIGVILAIMPMIAPMIGSLILEFTSWRAIFIMQAALASISLFSTFAYQESAHALVKGNLIYTFSRYTRLIRNRAYLLSNTLMGIILGPFYGHIAFSPIVYMTLFSLSKRSFSLMFGLNALSAMAGSFVCARLSQRFSVTRLLTIAIVGCIAGGMGMLLVGAMHVYLFAAMMLTISFFCGVSRPLSNHLVLEQVDEDIGSASSFLVFYQFIIGSLCMWYATQPWPMPILAFGLMALFIPSLVLILWPVLLKLLAKSGRIPK